jgi:hypothetical protein
MTRAAIAVSLSALTFATVGCGGGNDTSATETWAGDVCSSLTAWGDAVESATASIQSDPSADGLQSAVEDVKEATDTLTEDLRGLDRPDTEAGQEAEQALDELATNLEYGIDELENESSEGLGALTALSATLTTIGGQVSSTFDQLEQLDADGELQDAFENSDSCDELRSGS